MNRNEDYDTYRKMLPVMKHRLDDELEVHPQVYEIISSRVVILNSRMLEAKQRLALREGRLGESIRSDFEKLTKAEVESKVQSHPDYREAWDQYQAARSEHERWSGLLDAWRQKGYSIKTLAELYSADYYSLTATSTGHRAPNHDRERMTRHPQPPSSVRGDDEAHDRRAEVRRTSHQPTTTNTEEVSPPRRRRFINE